MSIGDADHAEGAIASIYAGLGFLVDLIGLEKGLNGGGPLVDPSSTTEAGTCPSVFEDA